MDGLSRDAVSTWVILGLAAVGASAARAATEPDASLFVRIVDTRHVLADLHASGAFGQTLTVSKPGVARVSLRIERPDDRGWSAMQLKIERADGSRWNTTWATDSYMPLGRAPSIPCRGPNFTSRKRESEPLICVMPRLGNGAPHHSPAQWPAETQRKLDAVHRLLVDAHPGAARDDDPDFTRWLDDGYREASALARHATSASLAGGVLRYYVAGFRDEHLRLQQSQPSRIGWAGWRADFRGDELVVVHRADGWRGELPPLDAVVESCDGIDARQDILTTLAAYNDRRTELSAVRSDLAARYTIDPQRIPDRKRLRECTFRRADGSRATLAIHWKDYDEETFPVDAADARRSRRGALAIEDVGDGRYWIRLPSFIVHKSDQPLLQEISDRLATLHDAHWVVFDLRGNDGGDSSVGSHLLEALTGGLDITDAQAASAPEMYALWRVSPATAAEFKESLADALRNGGVDAPSIAFRLEYARRLTAALATHEAWVRQDGGSAITPSLVAQWGARPRHFAGRIALVTDDACFSACLDFVDEAMLVPGTLRLGHTTAADTRYMEVGMYRIDDDLSVQMPRKVWLGRPRGNNVPYPADVPYAGAMDNDEAVRRWVLEQLH